MSCKQCYEAVFIGQIRGRSTLPAESPDQNIIGNLWGILVSDAYKNANQYENKKDLKQAMLSYWTKGEDSTIHNLYNSMYRRFIEVIKGDGRKIK